MPSASLLTLPQTTLTRLRPHASKTSFKVLAPGRLAVLAGDPTRTTDPSRTFAPDLEGKCSHQNRPISSLAQCRTVSIQTGVQSQAADMLLCRASRCRSSNGFAGHPRRPRSRPISTDLARQPRTPCSASRSLLVALQTRRNADVESAVDTAQPRRATRAVGLQAEAVSLAFLALDATPGSTQFREAPPASSERNSASDKGRGLGKIKNKSAARSCFAFFERGPRLPSALPSTRDPPPTLHPVQSRYVGQAFSGTDLLARRH